MHYLTKLLITILIVFAIVLTVGIIIYYLRRFAIYAYRMFRPDARKIDYDFVGDAAAFVSLIVIVVSGMIATFT